MQVKLGGLLDPNYLKVCTDSGVNCYGEDTCVLRKFYLPPYPSILGTI